MNQRKSYRNIAQRGGEPAAQDYATSFAAVIRENEPIDESGGGDPLLRFPKRYNWIATHGAQIVMPMLVGFRNTGPVQCFNQTVEKACWALNAAETYYDPNVKQRPVPYGMPVQMYMTWAPKTFDIDNCGGVIPPPNVTTTRPPMFWFYHWVDPFSRICQGLGAP